VFAISFQHFPCPHRISYKKVATLFDAPVKYHPKPLQHSNIVATKRCGKIKKNIFCSNKIFKMGHKAHDVVHKSNRGKQQIRQGSTFGRLPKYQKNNVEQTTYVPILALGPGLGDPNPFLDTPSS
jgi:hypothetical protein